MLSCKIKFCHFSMCPTGLNGELHKPSWWSPRFRTGQMDFNWPNHLPGSNVRLLPYQVFQYTSIYIFFEVHVYVIVQIRTENLEVSPGIRIEFWKKSPDNENQAREYTFWVTFGGSWAYTSGILDVKLQIYITSLIRTPPPRLIHNNVALVVPDDEHAFLFIPNHFPSFFF